MGSIDDDVQVERDLQAEVDTLARAVNVLAVTYNEKYMQLTRLVRCVYEQWPGPKPEALTKMLRRMGVGPNQRVTRKED